MNIKLSSECHELIVEMDKIMMHEVKDSFYYLPLEDNKIFSIHFLELFDLIRQPYSG